MIKKMTTKKKREINRLKQANYRARQSEKGMSQVTFWVSQDSKSALFNISHRMGLPQRQIIDHLLQQTGE